MKRIRAKPRTRQTVLLAARLLASCMFAASMPVRADVVRLEVGTRLFGQGWMFLDQDGACKVATAAHVVRGLDGQTVLPVIFDGQGRQLPAGSVLALSTVSDIAVLSVPGAATPALCGAGRLSAIGVERRVRGMTDATIETTGETELRRVPVEYRASSMDSAGGEMFAVSPTLPADHVVKGWSGSVVRDRDGPLGIIVDVIPGSNEALAVRTDVVRQLLDIVPTSPATPAAGSHRATLVAVGGRTIDPTHGPDAVFDPASSWQVEPVRRTVAFIASFPTPTQVRRITLSTAPGTANSIAGVAVSTQAAGEDDQAWTEGNYCRPHGNEAAISCAFLVRTVARLRIVVSTHTDTPLALTGYAAE